MTANDQENENHREMKLFLCGKKLVHNPLVVSNCATMRNQLAYIPKLIEESVFDFFSVSSVLSVVKTSHKLMVLKTNEKILTTESTELTEKKALTRFFRFFRYKS